MTVEPKFKCLALSLKHARTREKYDKVLVIVTFACFNEVPCHLRKIAYLHGRKEEDVKEK